MAVNDILDQIENLVVDARRVVFTNKCIIEEDDLIRLVDDLRNELPQQISKAEQVIQEEERILSDAHKEAAHIVEQAKDYAVRLTDESEIVQQAQVQAKAIMEKTIENSRALKTDSVQYANQVFDHLVANVGNALAVVQQAKAELNSSEDETRA
jgi:hypothetical protein